MPWHFSVCTLVWFVQSDICLCVDFCQQHLWGLNINLMTQVFNNMHTHFSVQSQVKPLSSQLINLMAAGLAFSPAAADTEVLSGIGLHRTQLTHYSMIHNQEDKKRAAS